MAHFATRPWIVAGVALAGAGVITAAPMVPSPQRAIDVQLTANDEDMVLDLVRHGQSTDNINGILGTTPPGAHLSDLGQQQADAVGQAIDAKYGDSIDGIYASDFIRTQETAAPLAHLLGMDVHDLSGLNEIDAGVLAGGEQTTLTGLIYLAAPLAWMFGQYWVPQLGSTVDPNGMEFEDRFSDAIQTIYDNGGTTTDGELHDVAFTHDGAMSAWVMMNVKNPDFGLMFSEMMKNHELLPNTGQVVVEGNPTDGWTLVSWDGHEVSQDPGLLTELFVDYRDLITAPQMAFYHIQEAIAGGDPTAIEAAIDAGFHDVSSALAQFPEAVFNDIAGSFGDSASGMGTDAAAALF